MAEPKTACRNCRAVILVTTAERNGGLCAPCFIARQPVRPERTPAEEEARSRAITEIRDRLLAGCTAEEFAAMRCPVCGAVLNLSTLPRGGTRAAIHVMCTSSLAHVAFHTGSPVAPEWWAEHRSGGWLTEPA
jgi:hypothetical protein